MDITEYKKLCNPILKILHANKGSVPIKDMEDLVAKELNLSFGKKMELYTEDKTKLNHEIAWARYYLKEKGIIASEDSENCILSELGKKTFKIED